MIFYYKDIYYNNPLLGHNTIPVAPRIATIGFLWYIPVNDLNSPKIFKLKGIPALHKVIIKKNKENTGITNNHNPRS